MYKRLRELRKSKNLSQMDIAKKLEVSQTGYSKYETGENDLSTKILIKLAQFYDVSIDYILELSDNPRRY